MLLSIIVPIYNIQKYLQKCVDSILNQSGNIEIILVDDGSTDKCSEICDDYANKDNRVKVIHKKNGGQNSARITGLSTADGEYIMFVDGDDWLEAGCIEKCMHVMKESCADMVCFGAKYVYKEKTIDHPLRYSGYYERNRIEKDIFPLLIENEYGQHFETNIWGKVFKRDQLLEAYKGIDLRITMGEDGVVVRPYVFKCMSISFIPECYYCYNQTNSASMTHTLRPISWDNTLLIRKNLANCFGDKDPWIIQINRNTIHNLFITSVSRFNAAQTYRVISKDIKNHIHSPEYDGIFRPDIYKKKQNKLVAFCFEHDYILPIYLYWRFFIS